VDQRSASSSNNGFSRRSSCCQPSPKSYSYNKLAPTAQINSPSYGPVLICNLGPNSGSGIREPLCAENKLMKMRIRPPHHGLQGPVQILERNITRN